jgi:hypothetical protein
MLLVLTRPGSMPAAVAVVAAQGAVALLPPLLLVFPSCLANWPVVSLGDIAGTATTTTTVLWVLQEDSIMVDAVVPSRPVAMRESQLPSSSNLVLILIVQLT